MSTSDADVENDRDVDYYWFVLELKQDFTVARLPWNPICSPAGFELEVVLLPQPRE